MIVDSSALLAILQQEPEAERLAKAIAESTVRQISSANWLEAHMVAFARAGEMGEHLLQALLHKYGIVQVGVTPEHTALAMEAYKRYGRGQHPARLNFGDCLAYALAKETGLPLLYKGEDFGQTDIEAVRY